MTQSGSLTERTYALRMDRASALLRRRLLLTGGGMACILAAVWAFGGGGLRAPGASDYALFAVFGAVVLISMTAGYRRSLRMLESLRITIAHDRITLRRDGFQDLTIDRAEVTKIVEVPGHSLAVCTSGLSRRIGVPAWIDDFDDARGRLTAWGPFVATTGLRMRALAVAAPVAMVAGMLTVLYGSDRRVVVPVGLAVLAGMLASLALIQRNPHVDERTRKMSWMILLPAASVAWAVVAAWRG